MAPPLVLRMLRSLRRLIGWRMPPGLEATSIKFSSRECLHVSYRNQWVDANLHFVPKRQWGVDVIVMVFQLQNWKRDGDQAALVSDVERTQIANDVQKFLEYNGCLVELAWTRP